MSGLTNPFALFALRRAEPMRPVLSAAFEGRDAL
jgi:hypothetical protein